MIMILDNKKEERKNIVKGLQTLIIINSQIYSKSRNTPSPNRHKFLQIIKTIFH